MKFLEILLSFLANQGKSLLQTNTEALSQHLVNNARRVTILLSGVVISIALFCIGFSMGFKALMNTYETNSYFQFTSTLIGSLTLCLVTLLSLALLLREKCWMQATGLSSAPVVPESASVVGPSMETALALLIVEIANELKERRQDAPKDQTLHTQT